MTLLVMLHVVAGAVLVVASLVVGVWGIVRARAIARPATPGSREPGGFGHLLVASHTCILAAGLLGLMLLGSGNHPDDPLHTRVYGSFMVVAVVAAYGFRGRDQVANVRVFAVASFAIAALGLRAIATGG